MHLRVTSGCHCRRLSGPVARQVETQKGDTRKRWTKLASFTQRDGSRARNSTVSGKTTPSVVISKWQKVSSRDGTLRPPVGPRRSRRTSPTAPRDVSAIINDNPRYKRRLFRTSHGHCGGACWGTVPSKSSCEISPLVRDESKPPPLSSLVTVLVSLTESARGTGVVRGASRVSRKDIDCPLP